MFTMSSGSGLLVSLGLRSHHSRGCLHVTSLPLPVSDIPMPPSWKVGSI